LHIRGLAQDAIDSGVLEKSWCDFVTSFSFLGCTIGSGAVDCAVQHTVDSRSLAVVSSGMSGYEAGDAALVIRRAEHADIPGILALCEEVGSSALQEQFGNLEIGTFIEHSSLSVVALEGGGKVVGFASFSSSCPAGRSEMWLECLDQNEYSASSILWIKFFAAESLFGMEASELIFRTVFATVTRADHVLLAHKGVGLPEAPLDDVMTKTETSGINRMSDAYTLYNCDRHLYAPRLIIREAKVEDHDDLAPIFQSKTQDLTDTYGEFFLADLIASQDEQNKCLVAEVDGKAAGLMSLSSAVQVDVLQQCFQLQPYNQLLKKVEVEEEVFKNDWTTLFDKITDDIRSGVGLNGSSPLESTNVKFSLNGLITAVEEAGEQISHGDHVKVAKKLRRCFFDVADADETSLTWTAVLEAVQLYKARMTLWRSWYGFGEGGRGLVVQAHEQADASRDDLLRVLSQKDPSLGPLLARALKLDELENAIDIVSYNDVKITPDVLESTLNEYEASILAYSGYRISVHGTEDNEGLKSMVETLAASSGLQILSAKDIVAHELEQIKKTWSDKESKPPTSLAPDVVAQLVCSAASDDSVLGRGFVLLDFPCTAAEFDQLSAAGVNLSGVLLCGDATSEKYADLDKNIPARCHFEVIDTSQKPKVVVSHLRSSLVASVLARQGSKVKKTSVRAKTTCSAFAITLFTLDDQYESSASEFMEAAFELFPDHDYCMITLPYAAPESALLQQFTRVPTTENSTFSHMLFIQHRSTAVSLEDLFLTNASSGDRQHVAKLLAPLAGTPGGVGDSSTLDEAIIADFELSVAAAQEDASKGHDVPLQTFLARCDGHVVAIVVIDPNIDYSRQRDLADSFRLQEIAPIAFHIDKFAALRRYYVDPIFECHTRFILEETLRLADRTTLIYSPPVPANASSDDASNAQQTIESATAVAVSEFVQLQPYQQDQQSERDKLARFYNQPGPATVRRQAAAVSAASHSALYALPIRLISEPRLVNNQRIVVVGASDCGIAFLESLLFIPYLQFTNLVLVSTHGLPTGRPEHLHSVKSLLSPASTYTRRHLRQINLASSVRVIEKPAVAIDRESKCVVVPADEDPDEDEFVMYDHLIIATGQQGRAKSVLSSHERVIPKNVFFLGESGNSADVNAASKALQKLAHDHSPEKVVIYGGTLMALQAVEAALSAGIPGSHISWFYEDVPDLLQSVDRVVWETVSLRLKRQGILCTPMHEIVSVEPEATTGDIASVTFASTKKAGAQQYDGDLLSSGTSQYGGGPSAPSVTESCGILICASRPKIDADIFEAISECGLVFDGHIVVDHEFRTVDESIYSGGTVAKFSRRYQPKFTIAAYSSREVGARIATALQQRIDPLAMTETEGAEASAESTSLPTFATPRLQHYKLPGGLYFMDSCIAEQRTPTRTFSSAVEDVSAQDSDVQFRYAWATLDRRMRLVRLTYVGTREVAERNLSRLVGFHEAFLNSFRHAHEAGRVDDIINFFNEDWARGLYCQHFEEFYSDLHLLARNSGELKEILSSLQEASGAGESKEKDFGAGDRTEEMVLALHNRIGVGGTKLTPSFRRNIQQRVIDYIRKNKELLSMYYVPPEAQASAAVSASATESKE